MFCFVLFCLELKGREFYEWNKIKLVIKGSISEGREMMEPDTLKKAEGGGGGEFRRNEAPSRGRGPSPELTTISSETCTLQVKL